MRVVRQAPSFLRAVYDNKLESNTPYDLCGPCTCSDKCVYDYTIVTYFDRSPFRTSSTSQTCFIPMTCCGPPVIYSAEKKCCMGALSSEGYAGVPVYAAPCNMLNLKKSESPPPPPGLGGESPLLTVYTCGARRHLLRPAVLHELRLRPHRPAVQAGRRGVRLRPQAGAHRLP